MIGIVHIGLLETIQRTADYNSTEQEFQIFPKKDLQLVTTAGAIYY